MEFIRRTVMYCPENCWAQTNQLAQETGQALCLGCARSNTRVLVLRCARCTFAFIAESNYSIETGLPCPACGYAEEDDGDGRRGRRDSHVQVLGPYKTAPDEEEFDGWGRWMGDDEERDDQGRVLAGEMIGDPGGHVPDGMMVVKCGYCRRFYTKEIDAPNDCIGCGSPY